MISADLSIGLDGESSENSIEQALSLIGLATGRPLMARSSAVDETIEERGSLLSKEATTATLAKVIGECASTTAHLNKTIHWIVQLRLPARSKGHLSNEARISKAKRDWLCEAEIGADGTQQSGPVPVAIRRWRHGEAKEPHGLSCSSSVTIDKVLQAPARWATDRKLRLHFEWVWDGNFVWLVQGDLCTSIEGIDPRSVLPEHVVSLAAPDISKFRLADGGDFAKYRKLANAKMYGELGYKVPTFYVLDSEDAILQLLTGDPSAELSADLAKLTAHPLVVRTDGEGIPAELRQMLPRSDELRTCEAALNWFQRELPQKLAVLGTHAKKIVLICHHFLPAVASAWCMAEPTKRMVRIESLWGIPEGMYWYPHDIFEVDTLDVNIDNAAVRTGDFQYTSRVRYKEWFVAPDTSGNWLAIRAKVSNRWSPTISNRDWFSEIAITSRRIAGRVGRAVNVMWFLDIHPEASGHKILPWYHEVCELDRSLLRGAPRFKVSDSTVLALRTLKEWQSIQSLPMQDRRKIRRIRVSPREPSLIRSQEFLVELSNFAKENSAVVILEGGVLSHAYYILQKAGCLVEIADLYGISEEQTAFNKMVRDNIPASIEKKGERVVQVQLTGDDLIAALRLKLVEEATEVFDANSTAETVEELADVLEVVYALADRLGAGIRQVQQSRKKKRASRGGFDDGKVLIETANPQSLSPQNIDSPTEQLPLSFHEPHFSAPRLSNVEPDVLVHQDELERHGARERMLEIDLPIVARTSVQRTTEFRITAPSSQGEISIPFVGQWSVSRKNGELRVKLLLRPQPVQPELELVISTEG
ncbi:MAG TPA: hypothetical protein DEX10_04860 [Betaproteobacteria bacterium]|nr:hypothetical protein [Betaproteobacteria bacterium]